ncbi:ComEC/Rec2 family competence protein [Nocardioides sp. GCM10027113]|uniref:ComEC/Rec2 family competence protein n=1 Tax=unclassified Nocardioides TaxID=2615069 RepID=UPI00360FA743
MSGDRAGGTGRTDLRMPLLALAAWSGGLLARAGWEPAVAAALVGQVTLVVLRRRSGGQRARWLTAAGMLLVGTAVAAAALLRLGLTDATPVADLAQERAVAVVAFDVSSDPRPVAGGLGGEQRVALRATVTAVSGRGLHHALRAPVLVLADDGWAELPLGARVVATGRLVPADDPALAALLLPTGDPQVVAGPDAWWRGAGAVRESIRRSVAHRPPSQAALVPALVDGDDTGLDAELAEDFRDTGLTHLLAVSGTNLTLVVGFLLVVARWGGVRGRGLYAVAAAGIVGFVLLARTEPSVVRAAAMGTVALLAMGTDGRRRGTRTLGAAVVGLLLVDPTLAVSVGFALSVSATAGILLLAPVWRDGLARWLPRWVAEAVAVPTAAQLACTPLVAAISGEVSLVAVVANLLVAPAVGPATVLGLAGGLAGLAWPWAGSVVGTGAAWCVAWIVAVARRGAALPTAAVGWGEGPLALALLVALTFTLALFGPRLVSRPAGGIAVTAVMVTAVAVRLPTSGWPPTDWVVAACDVGQGDALALRAGPASAVVVDAGPDPVAVDDCLDALGVDEVPLVVLTHFHADHVDGLAGVLGDREVGAVEVTPLADPPTGARSVADTARAHGVAVASAAYGGARRVGDVTLQVLWPPPATPTTGPGDGSTANDASVVLLAEVDGVRLLLTGDVEPPAQAALARAWPGLTIDVLKVPHHGSSHQDLDWLLGLGAGVALVSAGEDNDYGHPSPVVLDPLEAAGIRVLRTDEDGHGVVTVDDGGLGTVTSG